MVRQEIPLPKYLRVVFGMAAIVGAASLLWGKNPLNDFLLAVGTFLLLEHIYSWEEFTFQDFIGHEWLGFAMMVAVIMFNFNWISLILLLVGIGLTANFETPFKNEFKILYEKFIRR